MPLTNIFAQKDLSDKLFEKRKKAIEDGTPEISADQKIELENRLRAACDADAEAIVAWIADNGNQAVEGQIQGDGTVNGQGGPAPWGGTGGGPAPVIIAPGQPIVGTSKVTGQIVKTSTRIV